MTRDNLKTLVQLAQAHPGPMSGAVLKAAYGELVHPKYLQDALQQAGFSGELIQRGSRVELRITNQAGELVAWSNAPDADEAILHAVLGFLRERRIEAQQSSS